MALSGLICFAELQRNMRGMSKSGCCSAELAVLRLSTRAFAAGPSSENTERDTQVNLQ